MPIVEFIINLAGATMLLLFAVRMVRTAIERSYGASFQRIMTRESSRIGASAAGVGLALVLQSSAAVALLAAGFSAGGLMNFATGLAIVLGGDLGSALLIQILSFRLEWLVPLLLAVGGWLFVKSEATKPRQMGRMIMGIAFILISLRFLREAMDPIRDSPFLPSIAEYLANDFATAFIVGATLAFVMHSSVAAILMCVTLVQIGAIPFAAGLSLVLGANLGSAVIPVWLTRNMDNSARRIPAANLILRGSAAIGAVFVANMLLLTDPLENLHSAQTLIYAHLAFNAMVLLFSLPFCKVLERPLTALLADKQNQSGEDVLADGASSWQQLDLEDLKTPPVALSSLKRDLLNMIGLVAGMFGSTLTAYKSGDKELIKAVRATDTQVNEALSRIREFVAAISPDEFGKKNAKTARDMMEYAIRLETAGDVVARRLMPLASALRQKKMTLSDEGWAELVRMHEDVLGNLKLASNVLLSDDLESARLLSLQKSDIKRAERDSRKRHLKRLQQGRAESFETSDIHLETLRGLREFNSHISAVAYPILYQNGQLLETRLIDDVATGETSP